jgi:hypothetical protein
MSGTLQSNQLRTRVRAAGPSHNAALYLLRDNAAIRVDAHGGIPSVEKAMGDPEVAFDDSWRDTPEDIAWTQTSPDIVLRQIDRFHEVPDAPHPGGDHLGGVERALAGLSRVADLPGRAPDEQQRPVPGELEATRGDDLHEVAGVQGGSRRVEADIERDRPAVQRRPQGVGVGRVLDQATPLQVVYESHGQEAYRGSYAGSPSILRRLPCTSSASGRASTSNTGRSAPRGCRRRG